MISIIKKKAPHIFKILKVVYYFIYHIQVTVGGELRRRGLKDKRYLNIKEYENKYKGERCFIVAAGPSLNYDDLNKIKDEYTFGMNSIAMVCDDEKTNWRPTFYVVQDWVSYGKLKNHIDKLTESIKFVGDIVYRHHKVDNSAIRYPIDLLDHMTKKNIDNVYFSNDCYIKIGDGFTVAYSVLQIAVYMGFQDIYLLGADCDYSGDKMHFFSYDVGLNANDLNAIGNPMISAYYVAKKYLESSDVKVYNATRGGKLEAFERVNLESVLGESRCAE